MMSVYMMNLLVKAHLEARYEAAEMDHLAKVAQGEHAGSPAEVVAITECELDSWHHRHEKPRERHFRLTLRHAHR